MPFFKVWRPDEGESISDSKLVKGFDHESAARNWADWYDYDSSDFLIVGGMEVALLVQMEGEDAPVRLIVGGEMSRSYRARQVQA